MKQTNYQHSTVADFDAHILYRLQQGLPVCQRPYLAIADALAVGEMALILRIHHLIREQRIRRIPPSLREVSNQQTPQTMLTNWDKQLLALLRKGLPLSSRPFHLFAKQLDISVDEVLFRSQRLLEHRFIRSIGPLL